MSDLAKVDLHRPRYHYNISSNTNNNTRQRITHKSWTSSRESTRRLPPQIKKIFRCIQKMTRKSAKKKREWFLVHRQIIQKEMWLRKQQQLPVNLLQMNDLRLGSQLKVSMPESST